LTTSILPPAAVAAAAASTRRLLDVKEVGARLDCSWRHVLRLADRGAMPPGIKLGALRRWDAEQLEAWIAGGCKPWRTPGRGR
jgi:predicted DNA-binding transcriptional regulator AlpA